MLSPQCSRDFGAQAVCLAQYKKLFDEENDNGK